MKIPNAKILAGLAARMAAGIAAQVVNLLYAERQFMNFTYFTVPSFKKKQIVTTEGSNDNEDQPFVDLVIFCSKPLFLAGALLFLGLATSVQAQFTYMTNNGTITITGYTGTNEAVIIPSTIDGLAVTDIGTNAFQGAALTSVVIPDSVTVVGSEAFENCQSLTNLTLSLGLADIQSNAFYNCSSLANVTIPDSVTNIGDEAFYDCFELTNVTFGDSVTSIGNYAFSGLGGGGASGDPTYPSGSPLTTVTIPSSVTNIGVGAFEGCEILTAINVVPGNPVYSSVAGVLFNQNQTTLLEYPGGLGGSYAIPVGVTRIESNAFYYSAVASVTIPNSVISIGDYAFFECQALTNVTMAEGLASIGAYAFGGELIFGLGGYTIPGCPLTSITIPSSVTNIGPGAFAGCHSLTNVTIPNSVTSIEDYAFEVCLDLTSVTIPDSVTNIGNRAFFLCRGLTSVTIPDSVTSIGDSAFENCYGLTNVMLRIGVTSIGDYAFSSCGLTNAVTIPDSVTNIGDFAFQYCSGLTSAYFLGNAPSADSTVFSGDGDLTAYYLPGTTGWAEFATNTGVPTALWTLPYPLILNGSSGVKANQFGFTISWATNVPAVVEASTDLSKGVWTPIATNTLTGGTSYFSDPQWTNYPARFYRVKSQEE